MDQIKQSYREKMESLRKEQFEQLNQAAAAFRKLVDAHRARINENVDWSAIK